MSCEVAVQKQVPERENEYRPCSDSLTPEEWMVVRFYRGLDEPDRKMMKRMLSALAARTTTG